jgi:hypothetical protein
MLPLIVAFFSTLSEMKEQHLKKQAQKASKPDQEQKDTSGNPTPEQRR